MDISNLLWTGPISYPYMVRMGVPPDGSCFFHAILLAFYKQYQNQSEDGVPISRSKLVKDFRHDLSLRLGENIDLVDPSSPIVYDTLSRGTLRDFSKDMQEYSLSSMQKELDSDSPIDNAYHEFISNEVRKDIYILDNEKQDVYITGSDLDILYKGRPSIVLLYIPGHFELVGIRNSDGSISTYFDSEHPFIQRLNERLHELAKV